MDHGGMVMVGPSAASPRWLYPVTAACLDDTLETSSSNSAFGPVTRRILRAAPVQYEQHAQHAE